MIDETGNCANVSGQLKFIYIDRTPWLADCKKTNVKLKYGKIVNAIF